VKAEIERRKDMRLLRFACLVLALAAPALANSLDRQPSSSFGESIDVRVVNVEAVVTDRRGHRVQGLSASDFRLLVDGREVPIDYFTEVVGGEMATPPVEPGAPAPAAASAPGGKVGTSYLVFIDESFSIGAQRDLVLRRLADSLRLGAEDRMAVVAFDGRRIDLLSDWTADREALRQVLQKAQLRHAWGVQRLAWRRSEDVFGDTIAGGGAPSRIYSEVESATAAVAAAMRGIGAPPGRKVLLLLSGGWPVASPRELLADPLRTIPSAFYVPRPEELFEPVTDTANLLGYTIYPVDVQGIDSQSTWADASQDSPRPASFISSEWERSVHQALGFMAGETGGKAVLNSARLNSFARVAADTRSYYWLGFTPAWRADGQRHQIRVEVRRPGLQARARGGFSDLSRETQRELTTESLLLFGGGEGMERIRVRTGEPRRAGLWSMELPVTLEIPAAALTPLPADGGYAVQATLSMGALDEWGGRTRLQSAPLHLALPAAPGPGVYARYETVLKLRKAPQRLVFSVADAAGGGGAWAEVEVRP
jgi:VWFA-related protein